MIPNMQEEWLENHKGKINAKLCMVAGSILPLIMRDNVHVPGWLKKIGLAGLLCLRNTNFFKELWWYIKHACFLFFFLLQIVFWRILGKKCYD